MNKPFGIVKHDFATDFPPHPFLDDGGANPRYIDFVEREDAMLDVSRVRACFHAFTAGPLAEPWTEVDCTHLVPRLTRSQVESMRDWKKAFEQFMKTLVGKRFVEVKREVVKYLQGTLP